MKSIWESREQVRISRGAPATELERGLGTRLGAHMEPLARGVQGACLGVLWEGAEGN